MVWPSIGSTINAFSLAAGLAEVRHFGRRYAVQPDVNTTYHDGTAVEHVRWSRRALAIGDQRLQRDF
jgi:hypothetical protein